MVTYPANAKKALQIFIPFVTTHLCEQSFSRIVDIKTKKRNRLCCKIDMRVALAKVKPRISELVPEKQQQKSTEAERPGRSTEAERPGRSTEAERPGRSTEAERPGRSGETERPGRSGEAEHPGMSGEAERILNIQIALKMGRWSGDGVVRWSGDGVVSSTPPSQLGRLVSESACQRKDPGSKPAADMVDAARNTAWDLGKPPNNYRSNYSIQEWARWFVPIASFYSILYSGGVMMEWSGGVVMEWSGGVVVEWVGGVGRWSGDGVVRWSGGGVVRWSGGGVIQWSAGLLYR
ncbi:hypothetical protein FHG87_024038 [Trinorchestia longiramus]|nr:hypothetical protein FHG87_024038 [Trinorchestia longiramus]